MEIKLLDHRAHGAGTNSSVMSASLYLHIWLPIDSATAIPHTSLYNRVVTLVSYFKDMASTMSLPAIDANLIAALKSKMSSFTVLFDQFVASRWEQMRKERNDYLTGIAEDHSSQQARVQAIEQAKQDHVILEASIEAEQVELKEMEASISEYSSKWANMLRTKEHLEKQLRDVASDLSANREVLSQKQHVLSLQNRKNRPELHIWESQLGLQIHAAGINLLQFTYNKILNNEQDTTCSFVIDLTTSKYDLRQCTPSLPAVASVLAELNDTRDFSKFLTQMRKEFKRQLNERQAK